MDAATASGFMVVDFIPQFRIIGFGLPNSLQFSVTFNRNGPFTFPTVTLFKFVTVIAKGFQRQSLHFLTLSATSRETTATRLI